MIVRALACSARARRCRARARRCRAEDDVLVIPRIVTHFFCRIFVLVVVVVVVPATHFIVAFL